jgi:hypothetical protein
VPQSTGPEDALRLAEEIVAARAHLKKLEERFALLFAKQPPEDSDDDGSDDDDDDSDSGDIVEQETGASQVLAVFQRQPGKKVQLQSVVDELPDLDANLVRSTTARFARMGKLKKVKRGVYRYVETEE